jgi:phage-related protein
MGIFDSFGDLFSGVKDTFGSVFNGIKDAGSGLYNSVLKPIGEKAWGFGQGILNRVDKIQGVGDKLIDASGQVAGGLGNTAEGLGNFLGGKSNILLYLALGGAALIILPKIVDKVL